MQDVSVHTLSQTLHFGRNQNIHVYVPPRVARLADGAQYNVGDKASFRFASLGFGFWVYPLKYYNCLMGYKPKHVRFA